MKPDQSGDLLVKLPGSSLGGKQYTFPLPLGGFGISRFTLDNALYNLALSKGVEVFTSTKVNDIIFSNDKFTIDTSKMIVESNVAVGAFGKRSNLE